MKKIILSLILGILLANIAIAVVGVGQIYWEGQPYQIAAGASGTVDLSLQNTGASPVNLEVTLGSDGEGIAEFPSEATVTIPGNTNDQVYTINIEIPEGTAVGTMYRVELSFTEVSGDEGMVSLNKVYPVKFDVEVVEATPMEETGESNLGTIITWIIVIVVVLVIIWLILKALKKDQKPLKKSN
ncbi:MAG: hypothetical protein ABIE22_02305 [archaeon]